MAGREPRGAVSHHVPAERGRAGALAAGALGPDALAVAATIAWGFAYVPSAWLVERWPPLVAAGARLAVAGAVVLAALAALARPLAPRAGWWAVAVLALTQTVAFYGATYWGIAHEGAGQAAVLANTDALFVAALAGLVLGERLGRGQWAGLVLGLAGTALVLWRGPLWPPHVSSAGLVVVAGALAWGVGTVAVAGRLRAGGAPLALAGWQMGAGGLALCALGLAAGERPLAPGAGEIGLVVGLGVVGSALPLALFYLALVRGRAAEVSAWFFLVPVVGVATAWPLLGERPGLRLLAGFLAVTAGLWLVLRPGARPGGPLVDSGAAVMARTPAPRP